MTFPTRREKNEAEMARGQQVLAGKALAARFDPEYVPEEREGARCSPADRARRDAYRDRMGAQVDKS